MDSNDQARLEQQLFEKGRELQKKGVPTERIEAELRNLCPGQDTLLRSVLGQLATELPTTELTDEQALAKAIKDINEGRSLKGRYSIGDSLGRGGFGHVYRATDHDSREQIAIKFIRDGTKEAEIEKRGLRARLNAKAHENVLRIRDVVCVGGFLLCSMDLAERSIWEVFETGNRRKGIQRAQLIDYLQGAACGIDFLNDPHHIIDETGEPHALRHRDIKPQNILLLNGIPKVADFSLVKATRHDQTGAITGFTPIYAPPEFRRPDGQRQVHKNSDQFSLAATYCHLLTCDPPEVDAKTNTVKLPESLVGADREIVRRALDPVADLRWPSCQEFVNRLRADHDAWQKAVSGPQAGNSWLSIALMIVIVILLGTLVWTLIGRTAPVPDHAARHFMVTKIKEDCVGALEDISLNLPSKRALQRIRANRSLLNEIVSASRPEEMQLAQFLIEVYDGLLAFVPCKKKKGPQLIEPLNEAEKHWLQLEAKIVGVRAGNGIGLRKEELEFLTKDLVAYVTCIRANISLMRYRYTRTKDEKVNYKWFKEADDANEESLRYKKEFCRPYMTRGILAKYSLNKKKPEANDLASLLKFNEVFRNDWEVIERHYYEAEIYNLSPFQKVLIHNNRADMLIQHILLLNQLITEARKKGPALPDVEPWIKEATAKIEKAKALLENVEHLLEENAVIFITEAELECATLEFYEARGLPLGDSKEKKMASYGTIMNRVRKARDLEFDWLMDKKEFVQYVARESAFRMLTKLCPEKSAEVVEKELLDSAGIP